MNGFNNLQEKDFTKELNENNKCREMMKTHRSSAKISFNSFSFLQLFITAVNLFAWKGIR